jgi:hypothetical protein
VVDGTGRSLEVYLGLNESFDSGSVPAGLLNLTGVLDQKSPSGTDGYRLLVLNMTDIQSASPGLRSDFDTDGDVDGNDFLIWQAGFGGDASGDADLDGDTDGEDFLIWQQEFGMRRDLSSAGVPEPSAWLLLTLAVAVAGWIRR